MNARANKPLRAAARLLGNFQSNAIHDADEALAQWRRRSAYLEGLISAKLAEIKNAYQPNAARAASGQPQSAMRRQPQRGTSLASTSSGAVEQARAGLSGAVDAFTLGAADPITSAYRATVHPGAGRWEERFGARQKAARAQDLYDAEHYPIARGVGQAVGAVGSVAALGATPLGALGAVARFAPTAGRLVPRASHVLRVAGTLGGVGGAGGQLVDDILSRRISPFQDYAGAAVGGAVGGVAAPYIGATQGAAVAGGAIPTFQAAFAGRTPLMDELTRGATLGALTGAAFGGLGASGSNSLAMQTKGKLGEHLSEFNSFLRLERPVARHQRVALQGGNLRKGYIKPDHTTNTGRLVESKFGLSAHFTPNQLQAVRDGLPKLDVQHWLPRDIAAILASWSAAINASRLESADQRLDR